MYQQQDCLWDTAHNELFEETSETRGQQDWVLKTILGELDDVVQRHSVRPDHCTSAPNVGRKAVVCGTESHLVLIVLESLELCGRPVSRLACNQVDAAACTSITNPA